ncbi:MAG TPA: hypothetical protein VGM88_06430 [Kofleriaceae bacterium]|jgi:hypothetical protein
MAFETFRGPDFTFEVIPKDAGAIEALLAERHRAAAAAGRVACVYLTATWCPANKRLEKTLGEPAMQKAFAEIDVAAFDIDNWSDALATAGYVSAVVPAFYLVDAAGKPGAQLTGAAWKEDTVANMAPPLTQFFDAARANRPRVAPKTTRNIAIVVASLAVIVVIAWLMVRQQEHERRADFEREQHDRIQKSVDDSIHHAMDKK